MVPASYLVSRKANGLRYMEFRVIFDAVASAVEAMDMT